MQHDAPTESEANRLDRRQAMKAALGGAAAAAVFTAPRIEGFSTAPNYASAVTTPACANANGNATLNKTSQSCSFLNNWDCCWGGRSGSTCNPAIVGTTTVTPQVEVPPYNVPTLEASIAGRLRNDGSYSLTLNGFDDGKQWNRCVVSVSGDCNNPTASNLTANPTTQTWTNNGDNGTPKTGTLLCNNGTYPSGNVSFNITCYCTG